MLAMFWGSIMGVDDPPYSLDGPATVTLRLLGSLELMVRGRSFGAHPSMPRSFMSISLALDPSIPLSWDSTSVLSYRGVVSRMG